MTCSPDIISYIFLPEMENHFNLRQQNYFFLLSIRTVHHLLVVKAYVTRFFYKQHFHKQRQAENGKTSSKC